MLMTSGTSRSVTRKHLARFWVVLLFLGTLAGAGPLRADQLTYTYDALGRLQSVKYPNGSTVQYQYDAAGNRSQVTYTSTDAVSVSVTVVAISASTALSISWSAIDGYGDPIQNYDLYRSGTLLVSGTTATSYTDGGLASGTTYTYEVVAHDTDGTSGSGTGSGQTLYQITNANGGSTSSLYTARVVPALCGGGGYGPCTYVVQQTYGSQSYVREDSGPSPSGPWTNTYLAAGYSISGMSTFATPTVYGH
jgi:YD repeat-containing protein